MADAVTALSARERVDVCALPDELQLHLLWQLPELGGIGFPRGCWAACSLVCRRWRAILADQRSQCRCRAGDPQLLPSALRALTASKRPIVSLAVDRVEEAADGDLSAVSRLAASSSLRALALLFHGRYTQLSRLVLEPLAAALTAAPCSLTSLDLTSRGAHVSERLLSALVQGAPNLECLLLEGCVVDAEPAPDPDPDAAPLGPMSPLLRLAPRLRSLSLATSPVGTGPLAPQPGFPTPRTETLWSRFVRLESLDLSRVKLRRSEVDALTSKPGVADTLVALTLAGHTGLAPVGLASVVACCGQLRKVDLSGSFFADISFDCMMDERMRALETVSLVDCSAVGDEGVTALCKARTPAGQLRELALGGPFARLSDASLAAIGACGTLRRLVLQMGGARNGFSDDGFCALAVGAGCNLEALEIVELSDLAESSLRLLLPRSGPGCGAALRRLVLRGCELAVTDAVLGGFLPRAHGLEDLDVSNCPALTPLSAVAIEAHVIRRAARDSPPLRRVDVTGCTRIAGSGGRGLMILQRLHNSGRLLVVGRPAGQGPDGDHGGRQGEGDPARAESDVDAASRRLALVELDADGWPILPPRAT